MSSIYIAPLQAEFFAQFADRQIVVLTDDNTLLHCYPLLAPFLPPHRTLTIRAGELHKNIETCSIIWQQLTAYQLDRKALLLNLGGGVVGDMGGFCAATYKRGIDFIQLPTTLLAQVDASVGGKLGIDFQGFKNHIGLFQLPLAVWIDTNFLNTLPLQELRSGFAEVLKHCLIADSKKWNEIYEIATNFVANSQTYAPLGSATEIMLSSNISSRNVTAHATPPLLGQNYSPLEFFSQFSKELDWNNLVKHSIAIKEQITTADPTEKGLRKTLNFGHTIGHAIESYFLTTHSPLLHGEAVAWGMVAEALFSVQQGLLSEQDYQKIAHLVSLLYEKPKILPEVYQKIISLAQQDKKNSYQSIRSCALQGIGNCVYDKEMTEKVLENLLAKL